MMFNRICNTVANQKMLCAVLTTVGGLHLAMTESQPVLGLIDVPSIGWFSVQHTLGLALVACGGCCVVACMS
jgi:hypothetical protein